MGTEIKTWQIIDGKLTSIDTTLKEKIAMSHMTLNRGLHPIRK